MNFNITCVITIILTFLVWENSGAAFGTGKILARDADADADAAEA